MSRKFHNLNLNNRSDCRKVKSAREMEGGNISKNVSSLNASDIAFNELCDEALKNVESPNLFSSSNNTDDDCYVVEQEEEDDDDDVFDFPPNRTRRIDDDNGYTVENNDENEKMRKRFKKDEEQLNATLAEFGWKTPTSFNSSSSASSLVVVAEKDDVVSSLASFDTQDWLPHYRSILKSTSSSSSSSSPSSDIIGYHQVMQHQVSINNNSCSSPIIGRARRHNRPTPTINNVTSTDYKQLLGSVEMPTPAVIDETQSQSFLMLCKRSLRTATTTTSSSISSSNDDKNNCSSVSLLLHVGCSSCDDDDDGNCSSISLVPHLGRSSDDDDDDEV